MDDEKRSALLASVRSALVDGTIQRSDLNALLSETSEAESRRPSGLSMLLALGVLVMYLGAVLVYAVAFVDMPNNVQLITPFVFPVIALAAAAWAWRSGRSYWEQEAIMMVALASVIGATLAASSGTSSSVDDRWVQGSSLVWIAIGGVVWAATRRLYAPMALTLMAIVLFMNFTLNLSSFDHSLSGPTLALAAAFVAAGILLWQRVNGKAREMLLVAGVLTSYVATIIAFNDKTTPDLDSISVWHGVISVAVAAAFVVAPAFRMPLMFVAGGLGAFLWLSFVLPVATQSATWALVVVLMGALLIGTSIAGTKLRHRFTKGSPGAH